MPEIVPRWEWRWFGHRFGPAESRLATLTPGAVQESSETYLLSGTGDNVKVRDALMDIKVLRETRRDGLEQWTPVMKAGFPLPAAEVAKVFAALRLDPPPLRRASYDLEQFIAELAVPSGRIRAIDVQKRRTRYTVGGCMAEIVRGRRQRQAHADHCRRVGRSRRGHRGRPQPGIERLREHELPARAGCTAGWNAVALCRHRCRHQLDQVPRRRAGLPTVIGAP